MGRVGDYLRRFDLLTDFMRGHGGAGAARREIEDTLARREQHFLEIAERAIYSNAANPYFKLLTQAGIDLAALRQLIGENGLEGALQHLYDAGVYLTIEEAKGLRPVQRDGVDFLIKTADFDNPFLTGDFDWQSSGSRRAPPRTWYAKAYLEHYAAYFPLTFEAFGLNDRPVIGWRPETHEFAKYYVRAGKAPVRWFTQRRLKWDSESVRAVLLDVMAFVAARRAGQRLPWPRLVERQDAVHVARALAHVKQSGPAAVVDTNVSSSVRVCLAARDHGLDISGTVFRVGGEPYTPAKAAVLSSAGTTAIDFYGTMEMSWIGFACAAGRTQDDIHMATDKIAVIAREKASVAGTAVRGLYLTNLMPTAPKLIINLESGDYGTLEERDCGCLWHQLGLNTHLVDLRSYEKVTSEGVTFLGGQLQTLLEEVLPARFGGSPIDYQLVEEEEGGGLSKVCIVVAPGVGPLEEKALVATVLETLGQGSRGGTLMSDQWRQGETLRVVRREPYVTATSKVLPLHILSAVTGQAATPSDKLSRKI